MVKRIFIFFVAIALVAACNSEGDSGDDVFDVGGIDTIKTSKQSPVNEELNKIIESFTNPVEMANLMKEVGWTFSKKYLAPTSDIKEYDTDFKKSLGLGLLSADLGCLNIYEETGTIVSYITVIKRLADDLQVGQFFDFNTLKKLAVNNDNLDSLMFLSVNSFNRMDDHLRAHGRSNLSALVITGVWIESSYLATQVMRESPNDKVAERIGEQKIIIDDLFLIIKSFSDDPNFATLVEDLTPLKELYDEVKITYEAGETEMIEKDDILLIIQKETSIVTMSDEQLNAIIVTVEEIRNKLISL